MLRMSFCFVLYLEDIWKMSWDVFHHFPTPLSHFSTSNKKHQAWKSCDTLIFASFAWKRDEMCFGNLLLIFNAIGGSEKKAKKWIWLFSEKKTNSWYISFYPNISRFKSVHACKEFQKIKCTITITFEYFVLY